MNYSPKVLDHYHNPRNFGILKKPDAAAEELNAHCGDEIKVYIQIEDGKIKDFRYQARGCALTIASASVLSEEIKGQKTGVVGKMGKADIEKLLGTKVSPAREPCIVLALSTIKKALIK